MNWMLNANSREQIDAALTETTRTADPGANPPRLSSAPT